MIDCIYWRYGGGGIFRREVIILGVSDVCPCYREKCTLNNETLSSLVECGRGFAYLRILGAYAKL